MAEHKAKIEWRLAEGADFLKGKYTREHTWTFDGGFSMPASSSPSVVPPPMSNPAAVDPEEAFVASLSSCHMMTFLFLAARQGFVVQRYEDEAVGTVSKAETGFPWVSTVVLNPRIEYAGDKQPSREELEELHHKAHQQCFIANSVKTDITVNDSGKPS